MRASVSTSPSPLKLVAEDVEVIPVWGLDDVECCAAFADDDAVARLHGVADLAVQR